MRVEENYFIIVRKSFFPLKKLRFKQHLVSLYKKYGPDRALPFSEIVSGEFEHSMDSSLTTMGSLRLAQTTGVCFAPGLSISLELPEFPGEIMYGGSRPQRAQSLLDRLKAAPANRLTKPEEIQAYRQSLVGERSEIEVSVFPPREASLTVPLSARSLTEVSEHLTTEEKKADTDLDASMREPRFAELERRRKISSVDQARLENQGMYEMYKGFLQEQLDSSPLGDNQRLKERFDRARFTTRYGFFLNCWDGKSMVTITIR